MGLFDAFDASGSALTAERLRMDVASENLANAQTPGYRRKDVSVAEGAFQGELGRAMGVQVTGISQDSTPPRRVYDPTNPSADAQGYVALPNVDTVSEMVDLMTAQRSYEANVTAMQTAKTLFARTLDLLK